MGITNEDAARRKKEKEENEKKKKLIERKNSYGNAEEGGKVAENGISFLHFYSLFLPVSPFFVQTLQQEQKARRALQTKKGHPGFRVEED